MSGITRNRGLKRLLAKRSYLLLAFAGALLMFPVTSCIDEYWPDITSNQNLLVVDGTITNGQGPFTVKLSLSSGADIPKYNPLPGCEVSILDNIGSEYVLSETENGVYKTSAIAEGIIGRSYKIKINSPDGKKYESVFDELKAPVLIDTVVGEVEEKLDPGYDYPLNGYQFYILININIFY